MADLPKMLPPVERRRRSRRANDLMSPHHNWLITLVIRNPVTVGMSLALLVASVALFLVLLALQGQRDYQLHSKNERVHTVRAFCDSINTNAVSVNHETDFLSAIILNSVKQSKPFDRFYRHAGLPSYSERLRQAQKLSDGLVRRKVPILDCPRYVHNVEQEKP